MNPERWQQIDKLLDEALDRPPEGRKAFLEQACGGDEDLRWQVEALLVAHQKAGSFVETPALDLAARAMAQKQYQPLVGRRLGPYEILSLLGKGGMGEVYLARDTRLDRQVALKILPLEVTQDPERLKRFVREAKAASALEHPNIATIHELGEAEGIHYIVMEYVKGETLEARVRKGRLELAEILDIGIQVADALDEAHRQGITHRDIKPANLMLTPRGQVKVLDFGLAKRTHRSTPSTGTAASTESQTTPGLIMGTVEYMSPEQVLGQEVDQRTDLFSLGVVLYDMTTGRLPFTGLSSTETMDKILHSIPEAMVRFNSKAPQELEQIVRKCLEKDRGLRYQHASDLSTDLKRLKRDSDSGRVAPSKSQWIIPLPRTKYSRWIPGLSLAVLLAVLVWHFWQGRPHPTPTEVPLSAVPLTSYVGREYYPTFSPNGNQVAFCWNSEEEDNFDIYIKLIGAEPPMRLTTNPAYEWSPVWSPDGRWIAFLRDLSGSKYAVVLVPPMPGPERIITEVYMNFVNYVDGPFLSWSTDSRWLAIASCTKPDANEPQALWLISLESNEKRKITFPPESYKDTSPAFSPDGHRLAFFRWPGYAGKSDLYLLDLSSDLKPNGDPKCIAIGKGICASPTWTADGRSLVFSKGLGKMSLWRIDISGSSPPQQLSSIGMNGACPAISRGGNRLAYVQTIHDFNIWRMEITSPKGNVPLPNKLVSSTRSEYEPQLSPDGKKIAFRSDRSGSEEIWVCDVNGANAVQLTSFGGTTINWVPRWSPDGSRLTFSAIEDRDDVYVVNVNGGTPRPLTSDSRGSNNPSWSRDGKWILFDLEDSGKAGIYKVPGEGGEPVLVTKGGWAPVESPDGRYIYYYKSEPERVSLWRILTAGGNEQQVLNSVDYENVELVGDGIYFTRQGKQTSDISLQFLNTTTGKTEHIASFSKPIGGFSVSLDRRWIVYGQLDQFGSDLMLVENFK